MSYQPPYESPEQRLASARSWADQMEPAPAPALREPMNQMTERLQTVIEAAERAADAIRMDAEEQARRHLIEAQQKADRLTAERVRLISQLTDDLIEHATVVREHSEKMVGALEQAIQTVTGRLEEVTAAESLGGLATGSEHGYQPELDSRPPSGDTDSTGSDASPASHIPPASEPDQAPAPPDPAAPAPSASALLRATQLAVAGGNRASIGEAISREFGVDPDPVLDQVLGRD